MVGGAGFIGSHFVDIALASKVFSRVVIIDSLTYAGSTQNLENALLNDRTQFIEADLSDYSRYSNEIKDFDAVINFAAESHVDRSIESPLLFAQTNALGPCVLVNTCMASNVKRFIQVSTDEVYGPVLQKESVETDLILPTSPYSASKAAGEALVLSYWRTYSYPVMITRGCNTYGPRQYPEKLIPLAIKNFRDHTPVPLYGSGSQIREWVHVEDHAAAILEILINGKPGEIYNIGTGERKSNLELLLGVAKALNANPNLITTVKDRLAHDFRYALDSSKIRKQIGWVPSRKLDLEIENCGSWSGL